MKPFQNLLILLAFSVTLFVAVPKVTADIAFPECRWDEITFSCNCPHANDVCAVNDCSACLTYENDPRYYFLWKDIYCRKGNLLELAAKYQYSFVIPLLTMIILDLAVFIKRGFRKRKEIASVILVNCASIFVGIYLLGPVPPLIYGIFSFLNIPSIPFTLYGMDVPRMVALLVIAIFITAFEASIFIYVAKFDDRKKVIITTIIANLISLILGIGTLNAIYPHFIQPRLF